MPPKKNKDCHNAFFHFMLDLKNKQGRTFKGGMAEVAAVAGPLWKNMSRDQRRPYEEKARFEKGSNKAVRCTSEGLDVGFLENMEREEQQKIEEMKEVINQELKIANRTGIQKKMFFIIHINTFCYCPAEERHYPAEIAISAFTLEDGVLPENVFHRMVKPGTLPLGFAHGAKLHSDETHQIKLPIMEGYECNTDEIFEDMKDFLQSKMDGSKRMPILYCEEKLMKMVQLVLDTWCADYRDQHSRFYVYNLQYMFRILKNTVAGDNVWPSETFSIREIEKDVNAYAKGICCEYHDVTNVPLFCSKSVVIRYGYTICDNCCPDLNIPLIPGYHVPETSRGALSSRASSVASSRSTRSKRSSVRDSDTESVISFSSKSEWENQSVTSETSSSHAIHDDDDFPSLGPSRKMRAPSPVSWRQFSPNDSSSQFSQGSSKSYAGATGTSGLSKRPADMPSSVMNNMEKLSFNSSKSSDTPAGVRGTAKNLDSVNDFPALGRGRGVLSKGRGMWRPNNGS